MNIQNNEFLHFGNSIESDYIKKWKSQGKKIVGYYCANLPEEIIHAAGCLPFRIRGIENQDFLKSNAIMSRFNCSFIRSTLNLALNGKYDFLDGIVVANTCDHVRRMFDIFHLKVPKAQRGEIKLFFQSYPHKFSKDGWKWIVEELTLFSEKLIKELVIMFSSTEFEQKLSESIGIYEENAKLICQIDEMRRKRPPLITGSDFFRILVSNSSIRKEDANQMLKKIIKNLNSQPNKNSNEIRARLMLIGSSVDNPVFVSILEHTGGIIVTDNICTGISTYDTPQIYKPPSISSPIEKVAERIYSHCYCPRMMDGHEARLEFIKKRIEISDVDGIILQRIEFCDLHGCENAIFKHELSALGYPVLDLDREYFLGDTGRLRTRVEAFLEKIGRKK